MASFAAPSMNAGTLKHSADFCSKDVQETHRYVADAIARHEMSVYGDGFHAAVSHSTLGSLGILKLEYGAAVEIDPGRLDECLLVQMPQVGCSHVYHPRGDAMVTRDIAGVIAPTVPFRIRWERDCRQMLLKIPRRKLEQACTTYIGGGLRKPIEFRFDMDLRTPAGANWRQLMDYVLNNLALNESRAVSPLALAHIEEMVVAHLLMHQPHNYSDNLDQALDARNIAPKCVKRAEEYMENHLSEAISLSDIAEYAGVKVRTLCQSFKSFRNTSPMSALRDMRLERARADMMLGTGKSVTDIAFHWGFNHLGRFAILYKERFGERPHETLRR